MPWKEPGEKPREPRGREPWGPDGRGSGGGPDLEAWLRKLRRVLGPFGHGPLGASAVIALLIVLWLVIGGWTVVGNQQVGMLLRFGRLDGVLQPGLHIHFPAPIDQVQVVDLGRARTFSDEVRLLTSDGQLAVVDYNVQYRVVNARKFLYAGRDAEEAARNAATIAARVVVGTHTLRDLLERSDDAFSKDIMTHLVDAMQRVDVGLTITGVQIQDASVPSEVKQAFDGIAKAHEDAKAAQATARADVARRKVEAGAKAATLQTDAQAYRNQVVAGAQADVARFDQILAQYQVAPQVTRHRLWLDTMREVLSRNHVVINTGSGSVVVQFPVRRGATPAAASSAAAAAGTSAAVSPAPASAASAAIPVTSGPSVQAIDP